LRRPARGATIAAMARRPKTPRKLLVAAVGVAAVSYGCRSNPPEPVGNLVAMPPPPIEAGVSAAPTDAGVGEAATSK
jgi:hypothetical protein